MKSPAGLTDLELSPPTLLASLSPKSSKRATGKIRSASAISDSCEPSFSGKEELPDIQETWVLNWPFQHLARGGPKGVFEGFRPGQVW